MAYIECPRCKSSSNQVHEKHSSYDCRRRLHKLAEMAEATRQQLLLKTAANEQEIARIAVSLAELAQEMKICA